MENGVSEWEVGKLGRRERLKYEGEKGNWGRERKREAWKCGKERDAGIMRKAKEFGRLGNE